MRRPYIHTRKFTRDRPLGAGNCGERSEWSMRCSPTSTSASFPPRRSLGRVEKGFDWLVYRLSPDGLRWVPRTVDNFVARMTRLYEHTSARPDGAARRGAYVRRWLRWAAAGVGHYYVWHGWTPDDMAPKWNHVERVCRSLVLPA